MQNALSRITGGLKKTGYFFADVFFGIIGYIKNTYKSLWMFSILTTAFGLVMVASATRNAGNGHRTLIMQCIAVFMGYVGAFILSNVDYERLGELWPIVGGMPLLLELSLFVIGSDAGNGSDDIAWLLIPIGGGTRLSFQPSELLKIAFIITFSYHLSRVVRAGKFKSLTHVFLLTMHGMVPVLLVAATGDQGSAVIFLLMFLIIIIGAGLAWYYVVIGLGALTGLIPVIWRFVMSADQRHRFTAVYNPQPGDEQGILYQQNLSKMAIGSGQVTGQGLFKGPMVESGKNYADHNDFIYSVIGEELGFVGCILAILLIVIILGLLLRAATLSHDEMGRYLCLGYFGMIASQAVLNIGMSIGVLPVIGITLPFFSAGGSSAMCMYFGLGFAVNVFMRRKETNMRLTV